MADDGFTALDAWLGRALAALEPGTRAKLMRDAAKVLSARTRRDIAAQRGPDGAAWPARKTPRKKTVKGPPPVAGTKAPIVYTNADGVTSARTINIRSFRDGGVPYVYAVDIGERQIKTFRLDRVVAGLAVGDLRRGAIRKAVKMMSELRAARRLATRKADASGAEIGWSGRDARIAAVHQLGGVDYVDKQHHPDLKVQYPERPLLGVADGDPAAIRALIVQRLANR